MSWVLSAASVQGGTHKSLCQDACAYTLTSDGFLTVVADGAGSAVQASHGARFVVKEGLRALKLLDFNHFNAEIQTLCQTLRNTLRNHTPNPEDCATTALFCARHHQTLFLAHIGDGFVVTGHQGTYQTVFVGDKGEYVNETNFITDETLSLKTHILQEPVDFVAMGTDGLETVAIDRAKKTASPGFFTPFDTYIKTNPKQRDLNKELVNFLSSTRLQERIQDDRTLFIAGKPLEKYSKKP